MPAPSLLTLATQCCLKNVTLLQDVGSLEYFQIRDILKRIKDPEQLRQIELNSPQIMGEDAELWQVFIEKADPKWARKNYKPKNPKKWYEVYQRYVKEEKEQLQRDKEALAMTLAGLTQKRQQNTSKIVDLKSLPKIPRDPRMIANNGGVPIKKGFKKDAPTSLLFTSGSRTKLTDGKSVLTRARREAKEIHSMSKLSKPTHQLSGPLGQVRKAPPAMVKQYKTAAQPALKILSRPRKHPIESTFSGGVSGPSLEDREARLRAAMSGTKKPAAAAKPTYIDNSDEDDNAVSEKDDLFGEESSSPPSSSPARPLKRKLDVSISSRPAAAARNSPPSAPPARPMIVRKRPVDPFFRGNAKKRRVD